MPFPSLTPQGLTVSNSTRNVGSHKVLYVKPLRYVIAMTMNRRMILQTINWT